MRFSVAIAFVLVVLAAGLARPASAASDGSSSGTLFQDVPSESTFATSISWLAETGITRGCNPPANDRFCPDDFVTRAQLAALLDRALHLTDAPEPFQDVSSNNVFSENIGALAASGITYGCNPPANDRFCPDDFVTRAQLAAFLYRAKDTPQWPVTSIIAAGDIAACNGGAAATASLVEQLDGVVTPLGDLAYDAGTTAQFNDCYVPTWGRFIDRTRPALGNHDVRTSDAAPYFDLFGAAAGPEPLGYYSYELGEWLVIALNSNCDHVGGCGADSQQVGWLRDTLEAASTSNILAYFHHPRWSTGYHGDNPTMDAFWRTLADSGADVILTGHDHDYQRYTPLDAAGDGAHTGTRQFVVGTGGKSLRPFEGDDPRVEARRDTDLGVLELSLRECGYAWQFHTVDHGVVDRGKTEGTC